MTSYLDLWYQALSSEHGICVRTNDPTRAIQKLYRDREKAGDEALKSITIKRSPTDPWHLWLMKNGS